MKLTSFKAYDVRGRIPDEINEPLAYDIGRAYAAFVKPKQVAVGYDIRLSSPQLAAALKRGPERSRRATCSTSACGAPKACISPRSPRSSMAASWSPPATIPPDYNGMKFVREDSRPISADTGLKDMRGADRVRAVCRPWRRKPGTERTLDMRKKYLDHLLGYVDRSEAAQAQGGGECRQRRRGARSSTSSSRICRSSSSR